MATTLSQEWLPNLCFIVKYSENQPILAIFALPRVANISLGGGKTRDRNAEGRTRYVVKTDSVAEFDTRRIAAVFTADSAMNIFTGSVSQPNRHIHKFAYANRIEAGKRIAFVYLGGVIRG